MKALDRLTRGQGFGPRPCDSHTPFSALLHPSPEPSFIYCSSGSVSPAASGGSVSEEVQIKYPNLDGNLGSGSSQAWLGCSLNHRLHQSRVNQLLGLGSIPGRLQPPGGQCRGWLQCQWINRQGEVTEAMERPGVGVGVGTPDEVTLEKAVPMRPPGEQVSIMHPGL